MKKIYTVAHNALVICSFIFCLYTYTDQNINTTYNPKELTNIIYLAKNKGELQPVFLAILKACLLIAHVANLDDNEEDFKLCFQEMRLINPRIEKPHNSKKLKYLFIKQLSEQIILVTNNKININAFKTIALFLDNLTIFSNDILNKFNMSWLEYINQLHTFTLTNQKHFLHDALISLNVLLKPFNGLILTIKLSDDRYEHFIVPKKQIDS